MSKTKPLTPEQITQLVEFYERRTRGEPGDWSRYNEALHSAMPAIIETLAEKDVALEATVKFSQQQDADYSQLMQEHDELRAELQQANERIAKLQAALAAKSLIARVVT